MTRSAEVIQLSTPISFSNLSEKQSFTAIFNMQTSTIIAFLACMVAVAYAQYGGEGLGHGHGHDYYAHPKYQYNYGVNDKHTGDFKTAHEYRDGGLTKGSYSVLQPDGILRTVNYVVSPKGGFQAEVLNKGVAHHAPVYGKGHGHGGLGYGGVGGGYGYGGAGAGGAY